jgi:hypothetical protein
VNYAEDMKRLESERGKTEGDLTRLGWAHSDIKAATQKQTKEHTAAVTTVGREAQRMLADLGHQTQLLLTWGNKSNCFLPACPPARLSLAQLDKEAPKPEPQLTPARLPACRSPS